MQSSMARWRIILLLAFTSVDYFQYTWRYDDGMYLRGTKEKEVGGWGYDDVAVRSRGREGVSCESQYTYSGQKAFLVSLFPHT